MSMVIIETRRSKGVHKADLTSRSKEEIKEVLNYYKSNSYVAVKNYRNDSMEIKFERMGAKGMVNYCLKTQLTQEDLKSIGFAKTEKGNMHLTQQGCTINSRWDIEVKEPVKKIESKKSKADKAAAEVDSSKKKPLPAPSKAKVETKAAAEVDDDEDDDEDEVEETKATTPKKAALAK